MRTLGLGLLLAGFAGMAVAGDGALDEARYADGSDYTAKLFYQLDFGGPAERAQSLGLRFDNDRAEARGAPALFKASFSGGDTLPTLAVQGVDIAGPAFAARQNEDDDGRLGGLTTGQWIGVAFTAAVFGTIIFESADGGGEPSPDGTGGS